MAKKILKRPWVKWPLRIILLGILMCFGLYGSIYLGFWGKLPTESELADLSQMQASTVYDVNGQLIGKYYITDRASITYEDLPKHLINALIATEDARFYEHNGIDKRSLLRVFFKTILMGDDSSGGGSTITLQLAKNLYGRKDYGFLSLVINKLRESFVARRLEEVYSKNEILTLYFNTVPFSGNTYGIESAAQKFFNVDTEDLSLSQSATLVGTLKANHSFNPRLFPERSQLRRDVVLTQMVKYGYISEGEAQAVMRQKIDLNFRNYSSGNGIAPYFREQVRQQVEQILRDKAYRKSDGSAYDLLKDGLKIYTTLDADMQHYAEEAMREHMQKLQKQFEQAHASRAPWRIESPIFQQQLKHLKRYQVLKKKGLSENEIIDSLSQKYPMEVFTWSGDKVEELSTIDSLQHYLKFLSAGFVALDPHSGAVRAYIGGIDYNYFQYDHVVQSRREVGSVFKPFVYTAALEDGLEPCDYISARVVTYKDRDNWTPKNAGHEIDPDTEYSLTAALSQSLNTIAVKVLRQTGIQNVIDQVHKMGIDQKIERVPSIALGISDIRVIDMAQAYTTYLNESKPVQPFFITKIEDKNGQLIAQFKPDYTAKPAFSERTRQIMVEMLQKVVNEGTGRRLRYRYGFKNDLGGKTGTTQNNTDGWFIGLLPDLVTVTWVGHDNHQIKFRRMAVGQGANSALPIFAEFLQNLNHDRQFDKLTKARFKNPSAEVRAAMDCPPTHREGFFDRLFHKDKATKKFEKEKKKKKKKKGFFRRLFGGKD